MISLPIVVKRRTCFLLVVSLLFTTGQTGSPTKWQESPTSCQIEPITYQVGEHKINWFQAFAACKRLEMELATITTEKEELAMEKYLTSLRPQAGPYEGYWLAGTRHGASGTDLIWFTTGRPVLYRKFAMHQPDNAGGGEACVEAFAGNNGQIYWNDISCNQNLYYICQTRETPCHFPTEI